MKKCDALARRELRHGAYHTSAAKWRGSALRRWWTKLHVPWRRAARTSRRYGWHQLVLLGRVFAVLILFVSAVEVFGLRIQHTTSLPRGLYHVVRGAPPATLVHRGVIGLWCLPTGPARWAAARGYLRPGRCPTGTEPLAKIVLAIHGDTIDFDENGVRIGGRLLEHTRPVLRDAAGRPLRPVRYGRYVLGAGEVWVWSPYTPRSLDSRYLGPLSQSSLTAVVRPLWTVPGPSQ